MRLDKLIMFNVLRSFLLLALIFFPILYLSDFFFAEGFSVIGALKKLPMRYGQSLANLLLWGAWLGAKNIQKKYSHATFISMGFRLKDAYKAVIILIGLFIAIDMCVIVPMHSLLGTAQIRVTNWSIKDIGSDSYFVQKIDNKFEAFWIDENSVYNSNVSLSDGALKIGDIKTPFATKDFYIIWNDPKKLTWSGLKQYDQYLKYHKLSNKDVVKQYHVFISRAILLVGMVLCGFGMGWQIGIRKIVICGIISCWLAQVAALMSFSYALFFLWFNVALWLGVGLCCFI